MTAAQRLALVNEDENHGMGDESMPADQFEAIDVDPNAVSDLEFRLKVSNRLLATEKQIEEQRRVINRILVRFAIDGRPIPEEAA